MGDPPEPLVAPSSERFQILSLDGGGLRGIFSASALAQLEADFHTTILRHFDLVAGTSTGGLIALGLAAGRSPQDIVDFYLEHGQQIFPTSGWARARRLRRPYRPAPLRSALEEILGDLTLGESPVRLAIPSFDHVERRLSVPNAPPRVAPSGSP